MTGFVQTVMRFAALVTMVLASPPVVALGLGSAEVLSYLGQPLEARITLISRSEAELASVTAGLASGEDFRAIGLDRAAISVPLTFSVNRELDEPYILVTSELPINEPVVQLVAEVVWASGRMLRQYTLFLDPPTFPSPAPPVSRPRPAEDAAPAMDTPRVTEAPPPVTATEVADTPAEIPSDSAIDAEPIAVAPPAAAPGASPRTYVVQRGDTLWGIASAWEGGEGYSIHQVMLAFLDRNPDAFNRGNINSVKRGAALRMPEAAQLNARSVREAMLEAVRQEAYYRNQWNRPDAAEELPAVVDSAPDEAGPAATAEREPAAVAAADEGGRLELVPPAAAGEGTQDAPGQGNSLEAAETSGGSLVEELARAEEELVNARQENEYLTDRIRELEQELERVRGGAGIEDTGLAELEQRLQTGRQEDTEESPMAVVPPREVEPWYARLTWWAVGVAALLVAGGVWWLRRQGMTVPPPESGGAADRTVASVGREATESPGEGHEPAAEPTPEQPEPRVEDERADGDSGGGRDNVVPLSRPGEETQPRRVLHPVGDDEAVELDSEDPETKLDLARAYLGVGDRESARVMLEEVLEAGDERQAAEARRMLDEL